ncbi:MAG: hypothetical protein OEZ02_11430, partial [Anaerolineae bacterium]|nr:hypothetical protein [Anaerolineae bacterium]
TPAFQSPMSGEQANTLFLGRQEYFSGKISVSYEITQIIKDKFHLKMIVSNNTAAPITFRVPGWAGFQGTEVCSFTDLILTLETMDGQAITFVDGGENDCTPDWDFDDYRTVNPTQPLEVQYPVKVPEVTDGVTTNPLPPGSYQVVCTYNNLFIGYLTNDQWIDLQAWVGFLDSVRIPLNWPGYIP